MNANSFCKRTIYNKDKIYQLANYVLGITDLGDEDILSCDRLGQKSDERDRPIRIRLASEIRKQAFF